jgi:hypothetical protein
MICPICGFEQPERSECARCGAPVGPDQEPFPEEAAPEPPAISPPVYGEPGGDFGSGEILGQTFAVYFSNFLPFVVLTALALSPLFLARGFVFTTLRGTPAAGRAVWALVAVSLVCRYLATAFITYGVFQQMRGVETSIGDCIGRGVSSLLPLVGLSLVQGFAIWIGILACVVPGVMLSIRLAVSIPAAVTERTGITDSMSRSTFLTEGWRGDVFGVLLAFGALEVGSLYVLNHATVGNPALRIVLLCLKDLFLVGLSATASAVLYYRLRSLKESIDVDQIASVFA